VLLLGGSAGAGKSVSATLLARELGVSSVSVDALWRSLRLATTPETHPALHNFEPTDEEVVRAGPDVLCERLIETARAVSAVLAPFIEGAIGDANRIVLEGAWITPEAAAGFVGAHAGGVAAVYLYEDDPAEVQAAMLARVRNRELTERRRVMSDTCWRLGNWLRDEAVRCGLPVVASRPRESLVRRIVTAAGGFASRA
jgi:2-phosphoglycerate kinase